MGEKVIPWISRDGEERGWHVLGENPVIVQFDFRWRRGTTTVDVLRMTRYGTGGINSATGEAWGTPAEWSRFDAIEIPPREGETEEVYVESIKVVVKSYCYTALQMNPEWRRRLAQP